MSPANFTSTNIQDIMENILLQFLFVIELSYIVILFYFVLFIHLF